MKKTTIIILLAISLMQAKGQSTGISITGGVGTYDLEMLKTYHDVLISRLPVEARGSSYFPPFTNIRMNLFRQHNEKLRYGLIYGFSATGASANYTDYSAYLNLDQEVTAYQLGLSASYKLLNAEMGSARFSVSAYGDLRLGLVRDKVTMSINTIFYYYENNNVVHQAVSPMAEAGLDAMLHFSKISLGLEGGLLYDAGARLNEGSASSQASTISLSPSGDLKSGMSGVRGGIKLVFWIDSELTPE